MHKYILLSLQDGWTALMAASNVGTVECVKMLLDRSAEVNMQNEVSGIIRHWVHALLQCTSCTPGPQ